MEQLLHHPLETAAQTRPQHIAYICQEDRWTYAELHRRTNQLAQLLIHQGLGPGDRVGVFMHRSISSPAAVYGILKAGGVVVPMDPHAPSSRNQWIAENVGMSFIIGHPQVRFHFRKIDLSHSSVSGVIGMPHAQLPHWSWEQVQEVTEDEVQIQRKSEDPAYIMFTSGSTGTPKGIVHSHRSGLAYARLSMHLYAVSEDDVIGNHSPLHFDISTFGYFTSVMARATTVLCTDAHIKLPASLAALISKEKITIWYSVPLALIQIMDAGVLPDQDWSALRWIMFGGEPFPISYVEKIMQHTPNATWSNVYGPAEVNQCTYYHFDTIDAEWTQIPLGYVWDETDYLIEEGELLIASSTQMTAYWQAPEKNETAFAHADGKRYYRTGDVVSLQDGLLYFHGRKDRQAKIRGYRVELEEVESHILAMEEVDAVCVFARSKTNVAKMIVAAVVASEGALLQSKMEETLKQKVPGYACPEQYLFIEKIPRTSAGKTDVNALVELAEKKQ